MTTDETVTENLAVVRDGHTGELAIIPPEADDAWLAQLRDDGQPLTDLSTVDYTEQVVAALHGDPAVFHLDPFTQDCIGAVCRVFELFARAIRAGWTDQKMVAGRGAVLLMADPRAGTPMRCNCGGCTRETTITDGPAGWKLSRAHTGPCDQIHLPLTGDIDWEVAGRQDIMCPPCWAAQPKHAAAKAVPVKAAVKKTAANGTRRRRTSQPRQARKTTSGAPPDTAA